MAEIDDLARIFCAIDDPKEMKQFFTEIFTPAERHDLAMRWQLMRMVREGVPQRQIAAELGLSLCKITRGAKIVKNEKTITSRLLNRD